jgi:predicted O-methyltransferase YrrM
MSPDLNATLAQYCEENSSPESAILSDLVRFTWLHTTNPRQLSGHLQGRFLSFLSTLLQPECIVEIGTFTGYATICLLEGLAKGGKLITIDANEEMTAKAKMHAQNLARANSIEWITGNAVDVIPNLTEKADLIYVDADKQGYPTYLDLCLPLLSNRGLLLFDNTLWSGKVLDKKAIETDTDTRRMHQFNQVLKANNNLEVVIIPIRDGLTMVRKK